MSFLYLALYNTSHPPRRPLILLASAQQRQDYLPGRGTGTSPRLSRGLCCRVTPLRNIHDPHTPDRRPPCRQKSPEADQSPPGGHILTRCLSPWFHVSPRRVSRVYPNLVSSPHVPFRSRICVLVTAASRPWPAYHDVPPRMRQRTTQFIRITSPVQQYSSCTSCSLIQRSRVTPLYNQDPSPCRSALGICTPGPTAPSPLEPHLAGLHPPPTPSRTNLKTDVISSPRKPAMRPQ